MNDEYCTIAAEIDADLKTHYVIKIGVTSDAIGDRANKQRLKLVWTSTAYEFHSNYAWGQVSCERVIQIIAREMFGKAKTDYPAASYQTWRLRFDEQLHVRGVGTVVSTKAVLPSHLRVDWAA